MAETLSNGSLQQGQPFESLFHALDPMSLLISQNSTSCGQPIIPLSLTSESYYSMERGPRYNEYAELRERKLRMKHMRQQEPEPIQTPPRKQVKFQGTSVNSRRGPSLLAQSVPDFSSVMRKENRKPVNNALPPLIEMTPPTKNWSKSIAGNSVGSNMRGSKSASAGEKRTGMIMRKSYACVEELKGFSSTVASSIGGDRNGGMRNTNSIRGTRRSVLGSRQY